VKKTALAALLVATGLCLGACGQPPADNGGATTGQTATAAGAGDFLACMVSDMGGFDDKSFNQSGYQGMLDAKDQLGVSIKTAESKQASDYAPNLDAMKTQGCDLTITVGFLLAEDTKAAATANTKSNYAIIDDNSITLPNVKPIVFKTSDAAFLAGYLAAGYSQTGTVATFGGVNIPSVSIFMDGFADGVDRYNQDSGKSVKLLGWDKAAQNGIFSGDFEDQTKGKNVTKNFIEQGADIIMPVAGPVGLGAAAAAQEAGNVEIIWVDTDGYNSAPQYANLFLSTVVKEIGAAVLETIKESSAGNFSPDPYVGTLANGGVDLAPYHNFESHVPADLKAKIQDLRDQIIKGTLKVTSPSDPQ